MDKYKELTFVICIIIEAIKFCCTYIYLFKNSTLRNSTDFTMFNCQNKICDGSKINFKGVFIDEKMHIVSLNQSQRKNALSFLVEAIFLDIYVNLQPRQDLMSGLWMREKNFPIENGFLMPKK